MFFFFINDPPTTEIYTLSLHDALPIYGHANVSTAFARACGPKGVARYSRAGGNAAENVCFRKASRSEEHTSELQSQFHLVCRLLLEKKKSSRPSTPPRRRRYSCCQSAN